MKTISESFNRPILVTGSHRSGTTWMGKMIALDKSIEYVQEPFNINNSHNLLNYDFKKWFFYVPDTKEEKEVYLAFQKLFDSVKSPVEWARIKSSQKVDIAVPLRFLKHLIAGLTHTKRVLIKDPIALMSAEWLYDSFELMVICMIRNPLAFTGSLKKWGWEFDFNNLLSQEQFVHKHLPKFESDIRYFSENPEDVDIIDKACLQWNIIHYIILEYKKKYPEWLFLRHEDVAMNPMDNFARIYDYLGLLYSDNIRKRIKKNSSNSNSSETNNPMYKPRNSQGTLETWKGRLTTYETDKVIELTKEIATNLYEIKEKQYI